MKKHRREKKIFKVHNRFSAKRRRLRYYYQFVGKAFTACRKCGQG
ncbi:MAG: hypothetical protein ACPL5I_13655 [Thermodesulfobacteriota bacterium]